jgi:hypothetical protein
MPPKSKESSTSEVERKFKFTIKEINRNIKKVNQLIEEGRFSLLREIKSELSNSCNILKGCVYDIGDENETFYEEYTKITDEVFEISAKIEESISIQNSNVKMAAVSNDANSENNIKLPKFHLPVFSGSLDDWLTFKEVFNSTIDSNSNLTNLQKFQYLAASVKSEAAKLIKGFPVSGEYYKQALETLINRYDNKKVLAYNQLNKLFNIKSMKSCTYKSILEILDTCNESVRNLKTLGFDINSFVELILVYNLQTKLDDNLRTQWELKCDSQEFPKFSELTEFLEKQARSIQNVKESNVKGESKGSFVPKPKVLSHAAVNDAVVKSQNACLVCQKPHPIHKCLDFQNLSLDQRWEIVKNNRLCLNCFRNNHFVDKCLLSVRCKVCNKKHHTLLHKYPKIEQSNHSEFNDKESTCLANQTSIKTLLCTAIVKIKSNQKWYNCRALIDSGSQRSLISSAFCKKLNLKTTTTNHKIRGINNFVAETSLKEAKITARPHFNNNNFDIRTLVVETITMNLPNFEINKTVWPHLEGLNLADPDFQKSRPIDLLIGADLFIEIISGEKILGPKGTPCAINSKFGWLLSGPIYSKEEESGVVNCHAVVDQELSLILQKFWQVESVPEASLTDPCDERYLKTLKRNPTGRYIVDLPFKSPPCFGDSKSQALKRFQYLESKFRRNPEFKSKYSQFIEEYKSLNHMELVPASEENMVDKFYLPHHGVERESVTTSLRVVFDASAKDSNGKSLNDFLEIGPKLLPDLFKVLIKFRTYKIALSADIEKMFRQILVNPNHANYQRILWRFDETKPISTYRLLTVTYGTGCAPWLAIRTLRKLAEDNKMEYPHISKVIMENFYMDDLLCGSNSVEDASKLVNEINQVMESGGFSLRKWSSNIPEAIAALPKEKKYNNSNITIEEDQSIKLLGLIWNSTDDTFQLKIAEPSDVVSKRDLLSVIARIYDPLGLLSPTTVLLKMMFQELWKDGLSWNDPIPDEILNTWKEFKDQMPLLKEIKIPRFLGTDFSFESNFHIFGFADASQKAYAAVLYLVKQNPTGSTVNFLAAKTKVAPLSSVTLPRLELSAALLLAQLTLTVIETLPLEIKEIHLWSDSQIVLSWISAPPSKGNPFVTNRVHKIKSLVPKALWQHISGKINPADCASRGMLPSKLLHHDLWWCGPVWLKERLDTDSEINQWSSTNAIALDKSEQELFTAPVIEVPNFICKYSSFSKLIRITAFVHRFVHNIRNSSDKRTGVLTADEICQATEFVVRTIQAAEFQLEISALRQNQPIQKSSKLLSLNPFLDSSGILRVGGRLQKHQSLTIDQKHPMLMPKDHFITDLLIEDFHSKHFHAGPQLTLSLIRQKFWFTNGRSKVRQVLNRCLLCKKLKATTCQQIMGNLPSERVNLVRAFQKIGIDFCGPVVTKPNLTRSKVRIKSYICVIVCMCTKAVYIDCVSDLSTQALLACLRRFISRRGIPSDIVSDNGKNFVGLSNELKRLFKLCQSEDVQHFTSSQSIRWHFIPPYAPNFGGIWESAVKSTKTLLIRACKSAILNFEELTTLLCQIEALLNSRPLTPMSSDPSDIRALTPGHFLIGTEMLSIPESSSNSSLTLSERWRLLQKMRSQFWARWSRDYLNQLQQRPRQWSSPSRDLRVGDLVIIHEPSSPPLRWNLGRVSQTFTGADRHVRVINIKTSFGEIRRPISKVTLLLPGPEDVRS